jgi:transposase
MAPNFIECAREQAFLMPPSLRDWVPEEHLVWTILEAVEEMDLSHFYDDYRDDGHGRPAYDPRMMVALLLYAYARGNRSSRGIEREYQEDVAYRVIRANLVPVPSTIAEFRVRHEAALAEVFTSVLSLCRRAGLVKVGVVAVDGTKIAANASRTANRSYEQIAREILAEAAETDRREYELGGEARGDELPERLRTSAGRRAALREAREELERERAREHDGEAQVTSRRRTPNLRSCWSSDARACRTSAETLASPQTGGVGRYRSLGTTGRLLRRELQSRRALPLGGPVRRSRYWG